MGDGEKRFYIHCYLGKHRVDLVRQTVAPGEATEEHEPLPDAFERGRLAVFGEEEVILGPYPTDEEWFDFVLRRDVEEVVSTLNPNNPDISACHAQARSRRKLRKPSEPVPLGNSTLCCELGLCCGMGAVTGTVSRHCYRSSTAY